MLKRIGAISKCQNYGHTKIYCNHSPKCIKFGNEHLNENFKKTSTSTTNVRPLQW